MSCSCSFLSVIYTLDLDPTQDLGPLTREELAKALRDGGSNKLDAAQVGARMSEHLFSATCKINHTLVKAVVENVLLFKVPSRRLGAIVKGHAEESFNAQLPGAHGYHATLAIDVHKSKKGAQKTAHTSRFISSPDPDTLRDVFGGVTYLMAKRPFQQVGPGAITRLNVAEEIHALTTECNATYFANTFMLLAYDFMSQVEAERGELPPFKVPRLRFVKTALCLVLTPHGMKDSTNNMIAGLKAHTSAISPSIRFAYMIEERIPGKFVKYIHNGEPAPLVPPGDPNYEVAEFLCFTQHVQYVKSKGLAFISDYQGELFVASSAVFYTDHAMTVHTAVRWRGAADRPSGHDKVRCPASLFAIAP